MIGNRYFFKIADEISVKINQVEAAAKLIEEGSTVPFIARYRKEVTGNLDEVQIIVIRDRLEQLKQLDERREAILKSLEEHGHLTPELEAAVKASQTLSKLEDIYLPYRPKRKTRGMKAKEKGLEPLALLILDQEISDPDSEAKKFINEELGVISKAQALSGAKDIIAEVINEDAEIREKLRDYFNDDSQLISTVVKAKEKDKAAAKYRDYFEWSENASSAPSHRVLAVRRGAEEGFLNYHIQPEEEAGISLLLEKYHRKSNRCGELVKEAAGDSYKRLLSLSMETEIRSQMKKRADEKAITVFADNLRELLLASPMGQKITLALDPGLRTGCKLVCIDAQGKLLYNNAIYPLPPFNKKAESESLIEMVVKRYHVEAVAIGNGTGGREALDFCKSLSCLKEIIVAMVNESGASVYSASVIARKEFPDYDITVRGAVSIGRRLLDPLAELVKIDPKSIGVGQYQHDVDQKMLRNSLDDVVVSCVNAVGVDVNTASFKLLSYVAGLTERIAERIVRHREVNGPFINRDKIKDVIGVGPKVFEQAAGFLRVPGGNNPLDASAVHPESYSIVQKMADDLDCQIIDLMKRPILRSKLKLKEYVTQKIGLPTLNDIMQELDKPGRDPRAEFDLFSFTEGVNEISDLNEGMTLAGVVTNVTAFGAFVDIGVHQDGLVHISELSDNYISDPAQVVKVNQKVSVRVMEVDRDRKRIALSMKNESAVKRVVKVKKDKKPVMPQSRERVPSKGIDNQFSNSDNSGDTYSPFANLLKNRK